MLYNPSYKHSHLTGGQVAEGSQSLSLAFSLWLYLVYLNSFRKASADLYRIEQNCHQKICLCTCFGCMSHTIFHLSLFSMTSSTGTLILLSRLSAFSMTSSTGALILFPDFLCLVWHQMTGLSYFFPDLLGLVWHRAPELSYFFPDFLRLVWHQTLGLSYFFLTCLV